MVNSNTVFRIQMVGVDPVNGKAAKLSLQSDSINSPSSFGVENAKRTWVNLSNLVRLIYNMLSVM